MEVLMLGGLLIIVGGMLIASSRKPSADDSLQQAYIMKGLALAFFAVGAFNLARGLIGVVLVTTLDASYLTMGGWLFAGPLLLVFLFLFSRRRKIQPAAPSFRNEGLDDLGGDGAENNRRVTDLGA